MSTQEKRRLERLKKELDSQQKKLDTEKRKHQRAVKELKAEQNKVSAQKRELSTKMKKFALTQKVAAATITKKTKTGGGSSGIERKLREEIKDIKKHSETTKKNLRETRKDLDAANDEIKILRRKLKHGVSTNNSNMNERKIKQARREIYNMKRRLKIALSDLDKQAKYYESQLRRFKLDEQKWINRQREINKEKDIVIKYVFIDDIMKLKLYKENKTKARIKTFEGSEVIIKNIEIIDATDYDEIADDVIDKLLQEIELEFGKRKKRRYDDYHDHGGKGKNKNINNKSKDKDKDKHKDAKRKSNNNNNNNIKLNINDDNDDEYDIDSSSNAEQSVPVTPMSFMGDDMKDIFGDDDEDEIGSCFNELMKELTERTRDLHKLNEDEDIEILLETVKERHLSLQQILSELNYDYVDEIPEMNKNWQNEIYKLIEDKQNPKTGDVDDILSQTLNDRNDILQKVIDVLQNQQPQALLDEIIENIADDQDEKWKNILNEFGKIKSNAMNNQHKDEEIDSNQLIVCNELVNEMKLREIDLDSLHQLKDVNMEPLEEIDNILDGVKKRHIMEMEKLTQITTINDEELLLKNIENNNKKWEEELKKIINENKNNAKDNKQNGYYADELNGRIADLLKLIDIYNSSKSTKPDLKSLKNNFNSFVISIKDRHQYNHENNADDTDIIENDKDWKDNIFGLASNMTGFTNDNSDDINDDETYNDNDENKENIQFDIKNWWLNKDENRNDTVDEITVDEQQQCGELYESCIYLHRLLYIDNDNDEKEDDNDVITSLYFPIPQIFDDNQPNKHNMIATLYDGVILCKLINHIKPDFIDERVVHEPNAFNPFPINDIEVRDNIQLVISCVQSMGIQLKSYEIDEWLDPNNWVQYIIDLINALSKKYLNKRVGIHKTKELVRLVKNNEDPDIIRKVSGQQWLSRWINYLNSKPVLNEIAAENYNNELFTAMKLNNDEIEEFSINPEIAANLMVTKCSDFTNIKADDLCNGNRKLQDLFAADLLRNESGLDKLSDSEKDEYKSLLKHSSKSKTNEERFTAWINAALSPNITVIDLIKDLSSGYILLKLLDKSSPGCVSWRNVRKKIRHKFDKVNNCNMVMKLSEEHFNFSLVGMAGSDIVDSNEKFIHSLLSQLMRYYATRQLSLLLFKNATHNKKKQKAVTDSDILQWVNLKINECDEAQSKPITSFKDRVLSTCIFYIELLKAVRPNHVDLNLCNYNVKPLINSKVMDKQKPERHQNARYCMTLIRRFGGELFVIPHHLCIMENKAILAVLAAIMTISITDTKK